MDSLLIGLGLTAVTILSISGTFSAQIAMARRRSPVIWFIYGVALGPIGPILVWLSPPAYCPICGTATRGWFRHCEGCGADTQAAANRSVTRSAAHPRSAPAGHPALLPVYADHGPPRRAAPEPAPTPERTPSPAPARTPPTEPASLPRAVARLGPVPGAGHYTRPAQFGGPPTPALRSRGESVASIDSAAPPAISGSRADTPVAAVLPADRREPATGPGSRPGSDRLLQGGPSFPVAIQGSRGGQDDAVATSLLATGVFTGGTAGLVVGARYAIVRSGTEFHVLGPLDSAPDSIVLRRPLEDLDPLCVNDRCIISHRSQPTRALIAMRGIAGLTGEHLEASLRPAERVGEAVS